MKRSRSISKRPNRSKRSKRSNKKRSKRGHISKNQLKMFSEKKFGMFSDEGNKKIEEIYNKYKNKGIYILREKIDKLSENPKYTEAGDTMVHDMIVKKYNLEFNPIQ